MTSYAMLYGLMGLMLLIAIAMIVPTLLKTDDLKDSEGEEIYQGLLREALREEKSRLDEELNRGSLSKALHTELMQDLSRRAVEENRFATAGGDLLDSGAKPIKTPMAVITAGVIALVVGLTVGIYSLNGAPELMRLAQDQKVLEGTASMEAIETYLGDNPKDGRAWVLLARRKAEAGDFIAATDAYRRARQVNRKVAADPSVALEMGAALLSTESPAHFREAKDILVGALNADPENLQLVELTAIAAMQTSDWNLAVTHLRTILRNMSPDRPEYLRYESTLRELERRAAAESGESEKNAGASADAPKAK